jgi:transposase-like protein
MFAAAKRFFKKMMRADHRRLPFTISVAKNGAYPETFTTSQKDKVLPHNCKLRRVKYLNTALSRIVALLRNECEHAWIITHSILSSERCKGLKPLKRSPFSSERKC